MRNLTEGPILRHLLGMAAFIATGLIFQTAYFLIDLFFVARLGGEAVAGVSAAGSLTFLVLAASQVVGVGALSLIARAIGAKDEGETALVFHQSFSLALCAAGATLVLGYAFGPALMAGLAANESTAAVGATYLAWFLPSLATMFPTAALGSALRAAGIVRAPMVIQMGSVLVNAALAPMLIAGIGTGTALGVAGAGLASSIAAGAGVTVLTLVARRSRNALNLSVDALFPRIDVWRRIISIGLPAAGEFFLMFVIIGIMYRVIGGFGPDAQAGFGIGSRIMQSIFLPAMAISFASTPIAGQNFGAGHLDRVRRTFWLAASMGAGVMAGLSLLCQWQPDLLIRPFTSDPRVAEVATGYLQIASWNFVASGLVFSCSAMFQALGDTRPALLSSTTRLATFALPILVMSHRPDLRLQDVWRLSVASIALQAVVSLWLLRRQFGQKLSAPHSAVPAP